MSLTDLPILRRDSTNPEQFQEAVWSRVYNSRRELTRVPRAVVKPTTVEHIKAAVKIANEENCRVAVRSGGHSYAVWSVRHDSILLDLEVFKFFEYDEAAMTVACSPSTNGKELQDFLGPKNRSFPTGHMTDVGLGGFLLGGGFGWNSMNLGQACELIVSFDAVMADGEEIHCSENENTELFWLAHGCGPGFPGIITKFVLKTQPLKKLFQTMLAWPITEVSKALPWACKHGDMDTESIIVGMQPEHSPVPAFAYVAFTFKDDEKEAESLAQSICANHPEGTVIKNICSPSSIPAAAAFLDTTAPKGFRTCNDTAWLSDDADLVDIFGTALTNLPSRNSSMIYLHRPNPDIEKISYLVTSPHFFALDAGWKDLEDDEKCISWVRKTFEKAQPVEVASAISATDFQIRTYKFWSPENAVKVMDIRKKWDPKGRFCGYLDAGDKSGVEGLKTRA